MKKAKAEDLLKLVSNCVPAEYQEFYAELPSNEGDSSHEAKER